MQLYMYNLEYVGRSRALPPTILTNGAAPVRRRRKLLMNLDRFFNKKDEPLLSETNDSAKFRRAVRMIRTALVCFAAAFYIVYFITNLKLMRVGSTILSAALLAVFTFAAYTAVPLVLKTLIGERLCSYAPIPNARKSFFRIVLAALAIHIVTSLLGMVIYRLVSPDFSGSLFELWEESWSKNNTDVPHYINIAKNWYVNEGNERFLIVFYPMLPLLMRLFNLVFRNGFVSAQIINTVAASLASGMVYLTLYNVLGKQRSTHAAMLALLLPGAIFLNSPMTEPLFMLFCFCAFYFLQKHKFMLAAVFTALAGFTRSLGVVLAAAIFVEGVGTIVRSIRSGEKYKKQIAVLIAALLVSTLGTVAYLFINYSVSGDFLVFMEYEKLNWDQQLGLFFDTVRYIWDWCVDAIPDGIISVIYSLWIPTVLIGFASLIIITRRMRELPTIYTVFFLAYYVLAMGCTWLLSAVRYLCATLPLIASVAAMCTTKKKTQAVYGCTCVLYVTFLLMYMLRLSIF